MAKFILWSLNLYSGLPDSLVLKSDKPKLEYLAPLCIYLYECGKNINVLIQCRLWTNQYAKFLLSLSLQFSLALIFFITFLCIQLKLLLIFKSSVWLSLLVSYLFIWCYSYIFSLSFPYHRRVYQDTEKLSSLSKVTQLIGSRTEIWTQWV